MSRFGDISGRVAARGRPPALVVVTEAAPNPDYHDGAWEAQVRVSPRRDLVDSMVEAVAVCRRFISKHALGGGNWVGGQVYDEDQAEVARVSYNGRVWEPGNWPTKEIDARAWDTARAKAWKAAGARASEAEMAARVARFSPMMDLNVGDLVDAGPYGELYVTSMGGGNTVWVSPDQADVARGMGRAVRRELIRRVVRFASSRTANRPAAIRVTDDRVWLTRVGGAEYAREHAGKEYEAEVDARGWAYPKGVSVKFAPGTYEEVG